MNSDNSGLVTFRLDPANPPLLTPEEIQAWEEAKAMPDEDIDLSNMPERTTGWRRVSELVPAENRRAGAIVEVARLQHVVAQELET